MKDNNGKVIGDCKVGRNDKGRIQKIKEESLVLLKELLDKLKDPEMSDHGMKDTASNEIKEAMSKQWDVSREDIHRS